jgi:arginase
MTPLVLGGDHSLVIGTITASAERASELGVVWIDAHPDFNTPETTITGNIHGMGLAVAAGLGFESLVRLRGFAPKVHPNRIAILGVRDFDPGERVNLLRGGVRVWETAETDRRGVAAVVAEAMDYLASQGVMAVYLSVDLDVLDPARWPGVSTPADGGWSADELVLAARTVARAAPLMAMDIAELTPPRDPAGATAEAAIQVAEEALGAALEDP